MASPKRADRREAAAHNVDTEALAASLRSTIRGAVRFDDGSRALYSTDASNYRQVPIGVVLPRDADDIVETVRVCREFAAPVLPRGGGTSLAGQCCNVAVVLDTTRYMRGVTELDPEARTARVQPGCVLDDLRDAAEAHGLTFGPDPATHNHCTLGGMIGNDSCGVHSVMAGRTAENVHELEVLTYDGLRVRVGLTSDSEIQRIIAGGGRRGEIYARLLALRDRYATLIRERYPHIPRRVSGYNLDELLPENGFHVARALVGSEGTCVTILEAKLRLVPSPPARSLLVLGYPDVYAAADHVPEILAHGPIGLEGIDEFLVDDMKKKGLHPRDLKLLPEGRGWLLVEFGADTREESDAKARAAMAALGRAAHAPSTKLFDDRAHEAIVWQIRESGLGATARVPGDRDTWEGWEDSAVAPEKLGGYLRDLRELYRRYGYQGALYGHFGQGCVHTRVDFDLVTAEGIARFRSFLEDASDLVLSYGGSLSGEHGDGQARAELLPKMFGPELVEAFREFKSIWDPDWKMNPGKVVEPYRITENLRLGTEYKPAQLPTHFRYPDDSGRFSRAVLRCVGVGECRKTRGGTMCPSYRATLDDLHSTRGRARVLFEMLEGGPLTHGWKEDAVREALDLCLACKGCKHECPVNVDMATYKAEFFSHYYSRRLRPLAAYSMGLIHWWARMASVAPSLANGVMQAPGLRSAIKRLGGIAAERELPVFDRQSFTRWFRKRSAHGGPDGAAEPGSDGRRGKGGGSDGGGGGGADGGGGAGVGAAEVLLWPDTFNNYFHGDVARAATRVLEAAGFRVTIPDGPLCCGRPLYDFGMLDTAKRWLRRVLDRLRPVLERGSPIVVLEPSCGAVFRDELVNLFPDEPLARELSSRTTLFAEFLDRHAPQWNVPHLDRRVMVHGHCHQKALFGMAADEKLLRRMGADFEILDSGCCGMAGSFGFDRRTFDVSRRVGELVLLPAVRAAAPDTLIVTDGFSCRQQILETGRHSLHMAEAVALALDAEASGSGGRGGDAPIAGNTRQAPSNRADRG
jgi:FAD/FMN-containing dehydrogenase/Fe-S oxidoreductase